MSPATDPEDLFRSKLPLIERVIASICRRNCCYGEEAQDFASEVKLRLIENDYGVLAKFQGKSSLATYLTTVIHNFFRDYRIAKWGKWRPSAAARRLGEVAVRLEILTNRDRLPLEEAIEVLIANFGVQQSREELRELAQRLPERIRPKIERSEVLDLFPGSDDSGSRVEASERAASEARTEAALEEALRQLEAEDRLLLRMRFEDGVSVTDIAKTLRIERRPLYTRFEKCLRSLRQAMEEQGVSSEAVREIIGWEGSELTVDFGASGKERDLSV